VSVLLADCTVTVYSAVIDPESRECCVWLHSYRTGAVVVLDVAKKNPVSLQRLRGHDDEIHCICWAPLLGQETEHKGLHINISI